MQSDDFVADDIVSGGDARGDHGAVVALAEEVGCPDSLLVGRAGDETGLGDLGPTKGGLVDRGAVAVARSNVSHDGTAVALRPAVGVDDLVSRSPLKVNDLSSLDLGGSGGILGIVTADHVGGSRVEDGALVLGGEAPTDAVGNGRGIETAETLVGFPVDGVSGDVAVGVGLGSESEDTEAGEGKHVVVGGG